VPVAKVRWPCWATEALTTRSGSSTSTTSPLSAVRRRGWAWRDLPECYGNWKTVYNRHRRWSADGTWEHILSGLMAWCDETDGEDWAVAVDSTVVRAHQHAAGARHAPPKDVDADRLASAVLTAPGHEGG
jgi:transposase